MLLQLRLMVPLTALTALSSFSVALVGFFFLMTTVSQSCPPFMFIVLERAGEDGAQKQGGREGTEAGNRSREARKRAVKGGEMGVASSFFPAWKHAVYPSGFGSQQRFDRG